MNRTIACSIRENNNPYTNVKSMSAQTSTCAANDMHNIIIVYWKRLCRSLILGEATGQNNCLWNKKKKKNRSWKHDQTYTKTVERFIGNEPEKRFYELLCFKSLMIYALCSITFCFLAKPEVLLFFHPQFHKKKQCTRTDETFHVEKKIFVEKPLIKLVRLENEHGVMCFFFSSIFNRAQSNQISQIKRTRSRKFVTENSISGAVNET